MADLNLPRGLSTDSVNVTLQAMKEVAKDEQQELQAEQLSSKEGFLNDQSEKVNPFARAFKKEKPLKAQKTRIQKMMESKEKGERLLPIQQLKDMADQFNRRNPELKANVLLLLRESIKPGDSKEEILRKLFDFYADVSLADEALEYLIATSEGELARKLQEIKEDLNAERGREIVAGRNISLQARQASEKGIGTPTSLRDMYRDITGNPRDSTILFEELSQQYSYKDLKKVVDFLLHSLGADMKAKGPSIERGQLHRLFTETRSLQAILGVYRFFKNRMPLVQTLFEENRLEMPASLSFETMTKEFMSLAAERYPTADKVLQRSSRLGLQDTLSKIYTLNQLRDAVREVSMSKIYKSLQHRDDLYLAILEALEDLEDEYEDLQENEEEDGVETQQK
ncbi:MAG: HrpJ domain-containing protein [Parachlamydiaceae bacterium]